MFRYHWALALPLLCASCQDPDFGTGPITLSPGAKASFARYLEEDAPIFFIVTEDGGGSYYLYCRGGFNCTSSAARMQGLNRCRTSHPGYDCKIYAVGRSVVWRDAEGTAVASAARPGPELSPSARLVRDCLDGDTPAIRIARCSEAIASAVLAERDKRGPYYVRARAYEETDALSLAEDDYRAVLRIDPDHVAARARLESLAPAAAANN